MKRTIITLLFLLATLAPGAALCDRIEKTLPAHPGQALEIDLRTGGAITVTPGDDATVQVVADRGSRDNEDYEVTIDATSRGVRIGSRYVAHKSTYSSNLDVKVRVPRRFDIELRTMGGDVHLEGLEGRFSGSTMGGALELLSLSGSTDLSTMGGAVHVAGGRLDGKVSTMGGNVLIEDVDGNLRGSSMGGQVTYRGRKRTGGEAGGSPIIMSSMGGDMNVDDAPNGAEVSTMGGDVRIRSAHDHVKAETMGGDIRIDSVDGWVDASTMGGRVEVTVIDGGTAGARRDVRLDSKSGDLHLTVPAGFAMDVDIEIAYTRNSTRRYRVISDFPLQTEDESGEWDSTQGTPRKTIRVRGRVPGGAAPARVVLSTINGDVYLKRAQ